MKELEEQLREVYQDRPDLLEELENLIEVHLKKIFRNEEPSDISDEPGYIFPNDLKPFTDPFHKFFIEEQPQLVKLNTKTFDYFARILRSDYNTKDLIKNGHLFLSVSKKCPQQFMGCVVDLLKELEKDYKFEEHTESLRLGQLGFLMDKIDFDGLSGDAVINFLRKMLVEKKGQDITPSEGKYCIISDFSTIERHFFVFDHSLELDKTGNLDDLEAQLHESNLMRNEGYTLQRKIGEGGSRRVYLATDKWSGEPTCIKIFKNDNLPLQVQDLRGSHSLEGILQREARSLRRLSHPNLIRFYTAGKAGDLLYVEEEYIEGKNLREMGSGLSYREKILIFLEIINGVHYLHKNGFVIRDLKLSNVLVSNDKSAVKIDDLEFMGRELTEVKGKHGHGMGFDRTRCSDRYAAPELVKGERATQKSDIYALGCMLYYLLTGERDTFKELNNLPEADYKKALGSCLSKIVVPEEYLKIFKGKELENLKELLEVMLNYDPKTRLNFEFAKKSISYVFIASLEKACDLNEMMRIKDYEKNFR